MAENPSSRDGSSPVKTLYDKYQTSLPPQPEDKSRKGRRFKFFKIFTAARDDASSTCNGAAAAAATATATTEGEVISNENSTQNNNKADGSSSQKRKIPKTYADPPKVRGFEKDDMSLEIMLLNGGSDDSFKTIGVFGLPGVGKTTLCKSILKNERVKQSYDLMIWVSFSEKPNTEEETVKETLEHTGVPEEIIEHISDEHRLPGLLDALKSQLKDHRYLIVLDDVGEGDGDSCYETVKNCFENSLPMEKGGAVIVNCRSEEAAKKMVGDKNLHRLQPLSDPTSCWLIYKDAMDGPEPSGDDTPGSKDVMEELLKKCGGLPGAARMMGEIKRKNIDNGRKRVVVNSTSLVGSN